MKTLIQFLVYSLLCLFLIACERDEDPIEPINIDPGILEAFFDVEYQVLIFGPAQLYKSDSTSCTLLKAFTIEAYDYLTDDYYIVVRNGNKDGKGRVEDATITINDEVIFGPDDFSKEKGELLKKVSLQKNVELIAEIEDKYSELISLWIFGTHSGPGSAFLPAEAYPGQTGELVTYEIDGGEITCELINGEIIYQGDMILTEDQVKTLALKGASIDGFRASRWKNNTVYYNITNNCPHQDKINDAISEIQDKTFLVFEQAGTFNVNYIKFRKSIELLNEGMSSHVGMKGGMQSISVPQGNGVEKGGIMHEICHAVGMIHEHSRTKRDEKVKIWEDRIEKGKEHNFKEYPNSLNTEVFDFNSLMMYPHWAFQKKNETRPTITKTDGSTNWIWNTTKLSAGDIEMLKLMYPPVTPVGEPPVADFIVDDPYVYEDEEVRVNQDEVVQFIDQSIFDPSEWSWNFGDGNVSEDQNPTHIYNTTGSYTVSLTATNEHGASSPEIKTDYIKVYPKAPVPDFSGTPQNISPSDIVRFQDLSTSIPRDHHWDFGDGGTSTIEDPSHQYNTPGTYDVTLTVTDWLDEEYAITKPDYIKVEECMGCETGTVDDVDGNTYNTVRIGNQWWMAENLATTLYNDESAIPIVTDETAWRALSTPAYCWYENDESTYGDTYGALYNWYAVNTGELCPSGWRVPSDDDWKELELFLELDPNVYEDVGWRGADEGDKLKAQSGWDDYQGSDGNGTNESRFTALPGGARYGYDGEFGSEGGMGHWWTSTISKNTWGETTWGWSRYLINELPQIGRPEWQLSQGQSVRCVKNRGD